MLNYSHMIGWLVAAAGLHPIFAPQKRSKAGWDPSKDPLGIRFVSQIRVTSTAMPLRSMLMQTNLGMVMKSR